MIPHAIGIDHRNGSVLADLKTVRLGSVDAALRASQAGFLETLLEVVPGRFRYLQRRALRFLLFRTQENMALDPAYTQLGGDLS